MHSPPDSSGLFLSSPRAHASQGPSDEVTELALEAQNVQTLNPAVAAMLRDPEKKRDFLHHMHRQIQLITSRSQAFEDAHVTVYDKTLLTLTQNGNKLDHPPAIEYYCDEFLGVSNIADQVIATRMLEQSICVPKHLAQGKQLKAQSKITDTKPHLEYSPPSSDPSVESFEVLAGSQRRQSTVTLISDKSLCFAKKIPDMEPQVARLWSLYEKARADFQAVVPNKDSSATADSARFLRDTAENTIQYLKTKDFDPVMMAELQAVYDLAKATAVSATGGKKRKFDVADIDKVNEDPRRATSMPPRQDRYSPYTGGYHSVSRNDRYPRTDPGRVHKVQGRGPSGIPYGCTTKQTSSFPSQLLTISRFSFPSR